MEDENKDVLYKALLRSVERHMDALPQDSEIDHMFSMRFKRKMRKLMHASEQPKKSDLQPRLKFTKRLLIASIAMLVLLIGIIVSVDAWRRPSYQIVEQKFPEYSILQFEKQIETSDNNFFHHYTPTYIPDGFFLESTESNGTVFVINYLNEDGDYIFFTQTALSAADLMINTEGTQLVEIELNEEPAYYYEMDNVRDIIWYDNLYLFDISASVDKETLLNIAKSTKLK